MNAETWRPIPGFPGYEASDLGRVRSQMRLTPAVLAHRVDSRGYLRVTLRRAGRRVHCRIHQLVAAAFLGPYPQDAPQLRHLDGDRLNNVPANLAYGTASDNMYDQVRHGTHLAARKTACKRGHEYAPGNARIDTLPDGRVRRRCLVCRRAEDRARRAARVAA